MKKYLCFLLLMLTGCSANLKDYVNQSPEFKLEEYFSGPMIAHGIVEDYRGKMTRHFCVEINGTWQQTDSGEWKGTLDEQFLFNDGERQTRVWKLTKKVNTETAQYFGEAADVIGEAEGSAVGNAFHWKYSLKVPVGEKEYILKVDDWIYLMDSNRAFNRSKLIKYGMTVGEISIYFEKLSTPRSC